MSKLSLYVVTGPALAWVPWVPGNPRIFQQVYKESMNFEEGELSLSGEAKIRNPRIGIPNVGPVLHKMTFNYLLTYKHSSMILITFKRTYLADGSPVLVAVARHIAFASSIPEVTFACSNQFSNCC